VLYLQGCGLSDGKYITLGVKEVEDLDAVIQHIYCDDHVSTLGLWGRSMGAVTALIYSGINTNIAGTVRFTDANKLTQSLYTCAFLLHRVPYQSPHDKGWMQLCAQQQMQQVPTAQAVQQPSSSILQPYQYS
jgi:dienelactone hydrolase